MNETERRKRLRRVYGLLARLAEGNETTGQGRREGQRTQSAAGDTGVKKPMRQQKETGQ